MAVASGLSRNLPISSCNTELSEEELRAVEVALGRFLGPRARIVLEKEVARAATVKDLNAVLADSFDQPAQREAFMAEVKKAVKRAP